MDSEVVDNKIIINNIILYPLDVLNIKNYYYISKNGDIYSNIKQRFLNPSKDKDGYLRITLTLNNNIRKEFRLAQLVLYKFKGEPPKNMLDPTSEHKDGNINNNSIDNLIWLERNVNSSIRKNKGQGELNHEAILTESQVIEIAELLQQNHSVKEIAQKYNVHTSTISNIKNKTSWQHLTLNYTFNNNNKLGSKDEQKQRIEQIKQLLLQGIKPQQIIKMGFSDTSVYRWKNKLNI